MEGARTIGVAIPIPEPYGGELQSWRERLGDPRAAAIPTHVTLLPPTAVCSATVPDIEEHLAKVALEARPFQIHLRGVATFRPLSPVVFVALAAGGRECEQQARVRSGPLDRDIPFAYHPHVTIAHDVPDDVLDRAHDELAAYEARFRVCGFSRYEHGPDGVWRPQRDFPLSWAVGGTASPWPIP